MPDSLPGDSSARPSYTGTVNGGWLVTEAIIGAHPKHPQYPLLPGDLLIKRADGTFGKFGPGLGIEGFVLSEEQQVTLKPSGERAFGIGGTDYFMGNA